MSLVAVLIAAFLVAPTARAETADDAGWHTSRVFKGDSSKKTKMGYAIFSPKTANWRVQISSEKGKDNGLSSIQVTIFVEGVEINGKKTALRKMLGSPFRGTGGDTKTLTFDNGIGPDGKPRRFRVEITGTNVTEEITFQDQSPESSKEKTESKKGKKK